jgi:hypothetical protein
MDQNATFYVYLISRLDGRPCYVGKGKGQRWRHHGKYGRNKHLISVIKQAKAIGQELPRVKVLEGLTESKAFEVERALIAFFGRADTGAGLLLNLTDGGDGPSGYKPSPELIERQAATRRGRKASPEERAAISARLRGRPKSEQARLKSSLAQKGRKKTFGWWSTEEGRAKQKANNHSRLGMPHSAQTVAKIAASLRAYHAQRAAAKNQEMQP